MGAVEEIHERERMLIIRLAPLILRYLRDKEGGAETEPPAEREWGQVSFKVMIRSAPVTVTLKIDP
jgi:hypothetical protein